MNTEDQIRVLDALADLATMTGDHLHAYGRFDAERHPYVEAYGRQDLKEVIWSIEQMAATTNPNPDANLRVYGITTKMLERIEAAINDLPEDPRLDLRARFREIRPHAKTLADLHMGKARWGFSLEAYADPARRSPISKQTRSAVWQRSKGQCWYCGDELDPFLSFHVDHVLAVALGGTNDLENLVAACPACNTQKSAHTVDEFRRRRGGGRFHGEVSA